MDLGTVFSDEPQYGEYYFQHGKYRMRDDWRRRALLERLMEVWRPPSALEGGPQSCAWFVSTSSALYLSRLDELLWWYDAMPAPTACKASFGWLLGAPVVLSENVPDYFDHDKRQDGDPIRQAQVVFAHLPTVAGAGCRCGTKAVGVSIGLGLEAVVCTRVSPYGS